MKTRLTLVINPKDREDQKRIKSILIRKGYTLERVTDSFSHYYNKLNSLISVRKIERVLK